MQNPIRQSSYPGNILPAGRSTWISAAISTDFAELKVHLSHRCNARVANCRACNYTLSPVTKTRKWKNFSNNWRSRRLRRAARTTSNQLKTAALGCPAKESSAVPQLHLLCNGVDQSEPHSRSVHISLISQHSRGDSPAKLQFLANTAKKFSHLATTSTHSPQIHSSIFPFADRISGTWEITRFPYCGAVSTAVNIGTF